MLTFANKYKKDITSQFGENGILDEIIKRIAPKLDYALAVEFGAPNKIFCSNIYPLSDKIEKRFFDINPSEEGITKVTITPENVNEVIPDNLWVLSIDTDNDDYHIWKAFNAYPSIVIIEVNSSIEPPKELVSPLFIHGGRDGASYMSMLKLGIEKGYFLVCHTGNMIFVKNHFRRHFPEVIGDGIENWQEYFNTSHL